ncbi:MAG: molybdopterin-dependent oxidoreductase [Acidimicrobiales bacterium]|nr:molybdopterin-dependent oxidoreductase [Acidimicrobiales bacterium]
MFLRLRKAVTKGTTKVYAVAPWASPGLSKLGATVLAAGPGQEIQAITGSDDLMQALRQPGAVLMVGERAATVPGLLTWAAQASADTGARLAWVPRRAGERGALDAGLLPGMAPAAWGDLPLGVGFDGVIEALVAADEPQEALVPVVEGEESASTEIVVVEDEEPEPPFRALVLAGFDPRDVPDGAALVEGFADVPTVIALATHHNDATRAADIVFPVAAVTEKAGSFIDWEGRRRPFPQVFRESLILSDAGVLAAIVDEMLLDFGSADPIALRAEASTSQPATRPERPQVTAGGVRETAAGEAVLSTWRQLVDDGSMQAGEPYLAATARPAVIRIGPANAADLGISDGDPVTLTGTIGAVTLPALITDMPAGIVWAPANSGTNLVADLGVSSGDTVRVSVGRTS